MKCIFRKDIIRELRLVFRQNMDVGKERKMETPDTDTIRDNFDLFLNKWKQIKDTNNMPVLHEATLKACNNLKVHIQKGCLSKIPVGCGTNKNEKLHHFLNNSALAIGRIGPELAKALLYVLLFAWNCKRDPKNLLSNTELPIFTYFHKGQFNSICFYGNCIKSKSYTHKQCFEEEGTSTNLDACNYILDNLEKQICKSTSAYASILKSEKLKNAKINCNMDSLLWASNKQKRLLTNNKEQESHSSILIKNLHKLNLGLVETLRDGDCLFHAVAYGLNIMRTEIKISEKLSLLKIYTSNQEVSASHLRKSTVKHIKENLHLYNNFMATLDMETIDHYEQDGVFEGNIGDLLISAISNMLEIPIIIITARSDIEVIIINCDSPITIEPLCVAYDHAGPGHYSATMDIHTENPQNSEGHSGTTSNPMEQKGCRCGRSKSKQVTDMYFCVKSRCPCLKKSISCSERCTCVGCNNPNGCKKTKLNFTKPSQRIRRKKHVTFSKQTGHQFLTSNGEECSQGKWSDEESFLLNKIVISSKKRHGRNPTAISSTTTFNKIVNSIKRQSSEVINLRNKTFKQVQRKQQILLANNDKYEILLN